jgi:hypothetical protein
VVRIYDLVMTHKLDTDDFFIHQIQQQCARAGLNFFLIEPLWVQGFFEYLQRGKVWARALLNMHSEHHQPEEIFHRLVRLTAERNSFVIDPPDRALAAFDKARLHSRLIGAGIHVPFTVVVPEEQVADFRLADGEREALGKVFVIKPALGYGRRGLVMDATSGKDLARSVAAWGSGDYLLQRRVVAREVNGWPAYFRVYFVFGAVWSSWWNCYNDKYRLVTPQEMKELALGPLEDIIRRIAALTGMTFFSSEIAHVESGQFVVIDYVNDQCHMLSQSADPGRGVPDELVSAIARRLVEATRDVIRKR